MVFSAFTDEQMTIPINNITVNYFGPIGSIINVRTFVTLSSSSINMIGTISAYRVSNKTIFYITFDTVGTTTLSAFTDIYMKTIISKTLNFIF